MRLNSTLLSLWFLFASSLAAGCTPSPQPAATPACTHETPLLAGIPGSPGNLIASSANPNGQSDVAHLMREMLDAMKQRRDTLRTGGEPKTLGDYTKLKCAWPTDDTTRSAHFDVMADGMLNAIDGFNQAPTSSEAYNQVVSACLACHQTACPGPMAAIRPLHWSPTGEQLPDLEAESCSAPTP